MNSVIEAQEEFTNCFGELTIRHMCGYLELPNFSNEKIELDDFINNHQNPHSPVVINVEIKELPGVTKYKFY